MTNTRRIFSAALLLVCAAACARKEPLQGAWAIDIEATTARAIADGLPASAAAQIR